MNKFIDISGFGHSGKTVITDLLREFKGYQVPHYNFEFNLIRVQGGLLDLCNALNDNWSPIRSDAAIRRFKNVVARLGTKAALIHPYSMFYANGMNYDHYFNKNFFKLSEQYIDSLVSYTHKGYWPFPIIDEPGVKQFYQRIVGNVFRKKIFACGIYMAAPDNFIQSTRKYLESLFSGIAETGTQAFVMHNALEPFNPTHGLNLFDNARIIVVQRDPRDVYASLSVKGRGFIPSFEKKHFWKIKKSFLNAANISKFVQRQKLLFSKINTRLDDHRVLRLRFEDIILKYDQIVPQILTFLGEAESIHFRKKRFFEPEKSMLNIGLWKGLSKKHSSALTLITKELSDLCYYYDD